MIDILSPNSGRRVSMFSKAFKSIFRASIISTDPNNTARFLKCKRSVLTFTFFTNFRRLTSCNKRGSTRCSLNSAPWWPCSKDTVRLIYALRIIISIKFSLKHLRVPSKWPFPSPSIKSKLPFYSIPVLEIESVVEGDESRWSRRGGKGFYYRNWGLLSL